MPGVLPVLNKAAAAKAVLLATAMHSDIQPISFFDRKNYFYPDLPKGFQISQHFGDHRARHEHANANYPDEITHAMRRIWFAYGDLGYDGVNGGRAREAMENLEIVIRFFEERFGEKIG